ncbi:hypothetical protein EVAR_87055_1 [Eumeta japonica]|uniref:Uncharacterized protein n=1 Tax=Eumeta variegata TaxID=151549 RepID=A0A4C1VSJ8_EUMVA|nr:hypothetical protein EVAR_87055_1 [Eumeta japonica]
MVSRRAAPPSRLARKHRLSPAAPASANSAGRGNSTTQENCCLRRKWGRRMVRTCPGDKADAAARSEN